MSVASASPAIADDSPASDDDDGDGADIRLGSVRSSAPRCTECRASPKLGLMRVSGGHSVISVTPLSVEATSTERVPTWTKSKARRGDKASDSRTRSMAPSPKATARRRHHTAPAPATSMAKNTIAGHGVGIDVADGAGDDAADGVDGDAHVLGDDNGACSADDDGDDGGAAAELRATRSANVSAPPPAFGPCGARGVRGVRGDVVFVAADGDDDVVCRSCASTDNETVLKAATTTTARAVMFISHSDPGGPRSLSPESPRGRPRSRPRHGPPDGR